MTAKWYKAAARVGTNARQATATVHATRYRARRETLAITMIREPLYFPADAGDPQRARWHHALAQAIVLTA
jgi:hypothetical protein